jgi:DNA-binding CsgD family transcriptional regulator
MFPNVDPQALMGYFRDSANRADHLKFLAGGLASDLDPYLPLVKVPVLIIAERGDIRLPGQDDVGQKIAPRIQGSRLVHGAAMYSREGDATPMAHLVESFLDDIGFASGSQIASVPNGLSVREVEVLRLIAAGKSNPQIAEELVISLNTVQRHVSNILAKTGLANRTEAASFATRNRLV